MDPVSQVLAQQQSGSAGGQGFGQFFVAGQQNARQKEQLNLANRAETRMQARQDALLPYEQSLMAAQIVAAGQTAAYNRQKYLTMLQQNNAMPEILQLESYFMQAQRGYKDQDGLRAYEVLRNKYPQAFAEGAPGHNLRMRVQMPTVLDAEMARLNAANAALSPELRARGGYVQRFQDGNPVIGEFPNTAQRLTPEERAALAKMGGLEPSGLDTNGQVTYARPVKQTGTILRQLPDGTTEVIQGASMDDLTNINRSKAQASMMAGQKAIAALDDIEVRAQDVGIQGTVGELIDYFGPQFGLANADMQRMDTRTKIRSFVETVKRKVTEDDRFTEGDRAAVKGIVPSDSIKENEQTFRQKKDTLKQLFGVSTLIEAQALGQPPPVWAMQAMSNKRLMEAAVDGLIDDDGILAAQRAGLLTKEQAVEAHDKRFARKQQQ